MIATPIRSRRVLAGGARQAVAGDPRHAGGPRADGPFDPGFGESHLGSPSNFQVAEFVNQFRCRNELRKRDLPPFRARGNRDSVPDAAQSTCGGVLHLPEAVMPVKARKQIVDGACQAATGFANLSGVSR